MERSEINKKVKQAYLHAKEFPEFMDQFKPSIQRIIDEYVPSDFTKPWHVNADIDYLAKRSKENNYNAGRFLNLIVEYIMMIISAVERGERDPLKNLGQSDLFEDD